MMATETLSVDGNQITAVSAVAIEPNGDYTLNVSLYDGTREPNEEPLHSETHIGNTHERNAERDAAIEHIRQLATSGQGRIERTRQQQLCDASDSGCSSNNVILTAFPFTTPDYVRNIVRQFGNARSAGGRGTDCRDPNSSCGSGDGGLVPGVTYTSEMLVNDSLNRYINPGGGEFMNDESNSGNGSLFGGRSACTPPLIAVPKNFWALDCDMKSWGSCDNAEGFMRARERLVIYMTENQEEQTTKEEQRANEINNAVNGAVSRRNL